MNVLFELNLVDGLNYFFKTNDFCVKIVNFMCFVENKRVLGNDMFCEIGDLFKELEIRKV